MFNVPSATLKSTGARSGQVREAQIAYFHDGPDVIVMASNYGGAKHPQWYHNLVAHPECELGDEAFRATEVTDPDEYARLYGLAERYYAGFADYRTKPRRRPQDSGVPSYSEVRFGRSVRCRTARSRARRVLGRTSG